MIQLVSCSQNPVKIDDFLYKIQSLHEGVRPRPLKGAINFYTQIWEENLHFGEFGAQNQLNFEAVLERKLCLRALQLGFRDSYGTLGPLTCISRTPGLVKVPGDD